MSPGRNMQLPALAQALRNARRVVVLTGAGVSAESGIPTFRDAQSGLWAKYDPLQLATPEAFAGDPELVWGWYRYRRELVRECAPNPAHVALAELQDLLPDMTLITQNVDGLHAVAGSRDVIEFHGNLFENRCSREGTVVECADESQLPYCPQCAAPLRPGVVWFGEGIPEEASERAFSAAGRCDVLLSVGTSSLVYPAAGLIEVARRSGAAVAEINPHPTELAHTLKFAIADKAGIVLPALVAAVSNPATSG